MQIDMTQATESKPKVIKANKSLQAKVGTGPLDQEAVEKCQMVIDNNDVDFTPLAMEYLDKLKNAIITAKDPSTPTQKAVANMTAPVMELKANASTFKYTLIGTLANVMLSFLEGIEKMDQDAIAIVEAHHKTLTAIVLKKMTGNGGTFGQQMEEELKGACKRYFSRK
ncbi:MAG: hypothetical protein AB8B83_04530 [Bdellovibrionales bacterium]